VSGQQPLRTDDFAYDLPPELIAQEPATPRDSCRLLILDRQTGECVHSCFRDIGSSLRTGDLLVVNETRVLPARLQGQRADTGGAVEVLLLRAIDEERNQWECLVKPGKRVREGTALIFYDGSELHSSCRGALCAPASGKRQEQAGAWKAPLRFTSNENARGREEYPLAILTGTVDSTGDAGLRTITFDSKEEEFHSAIHRLGTLPLPPYIKHYSGNPEEYQTIYAKDEHSAAAPTAGLHFTPELLAQLQQSGVNIAKVRLDVGLDTFRPVTEDDPRNHQIHTEYYQVPPETIEAIEATREHKGRVIAVGTTVVRSLESYAATGDAAGQTALFILPGYDFKVVDALLTNFHISRSTLMMLVSAFAGREHILAAYNEAVRERYRFLSFGDAMLIA